MGIKKRDLMKRSKEKSLTDIIAQTERNLNMEVGQ